jgi:hypothetical protein
LNRVVSTDDLSGGKEEAVGSLSPGVEKDIEQLSINSDPDMD